MSYRETEHLRVLIANERKDRLALVAPMVANLGHEVIAREVDVADVGVVTARERPDVALVGLGKSSEHALVMIDMIVQEAACPVILLIHTPDPAFVKEASKRGIFAYITDAEVDDWQSAIDIVLRRFTSASAVAKKRPPSRRRTAMPGNVSSPGFSSRSRKNWVPGSRPSSGIGGLVAT